MKIILTIAGSDTSAGAGIQQDLKTITHLGQYAATVPTALTSQNTLGVHGVMPVPADVLRQQIDAVLSDMDVAAIKLGMIPNKQSAEVIVDAILGYRQRPGKADMPVVCDPVMISTSGTPLMTDDCIDYIHHHLFPLCTLVTPNLPESVRLNGDYHTAFLVKGGHAEGDSMIDILHLVDGTTVQFSSPRIPSHNLHGTGCTLSSAIATYLALGHSLPEAVRQAKDIINFGICQGADLKLGHGNGPLWLG